MDGTLRKDHNWYESFELYIQREYPLFSMIHNSEIFSYLKTGLSGVGNDEIEILENYCVAFGISGGDWANDKQWEFAGEDKERFREEYVNEIREFWPNFDPNEK